ncbi:hypothetical protein CRG98_018273 [Punica granatum]|uniref:Uncharacterized protein n=1 Tax=Punica granatum TaxID=22663 RepID=A0A2I0JYB9_PUNGR|nr:hypothetical protein CRG98_018273 [Punica granatum]
MQRWKELGCGIQPYSRRKRCPSLGGTMKAHGSPPQGLTAGSMTRPWLGTSPTLTLVVSLMRYTKRVGDAAVGVARLGWKLRATRTCQDLNKPENVRESRVENVLNPVREKQMNGGCARLIGPRTVTTSSRGRVRVVRNPLNVMARLAEVVGENGTWMRSGGHG